MNQIVRRRQDIPKFIHLTISTRVFLFEQSSILAENKLKKCRSAGRENGCQMPQNLVFLTKDVQGCELYTD